VCSFAFNDDGNSRKNAADDGASTITGASSDGGSSSVMSLIEQQQRRRRALQQSGGGGGTGPWFTASAAAASSLSSRPLSAVAGSSLSPPPSYDTADARPSDRIGSWFTPSAAGLSASSMDLPPEQPLQPHITPPPQSPVPLLPPSAVAAAAAPPDIDAFVRACAPTAAAASEALARYSLGVAKADADYHALVLGGPDSSSATMGHERKNPTHDLLPTTASAKMKRRKHTKAANKPPIAPATIAPVCAHCHQRFLHELNGLSLVHLPAPGDAPLAVADFQARQLAHAKRTQDHVSTEWYPALLKAFAAAEGSQSPPPQSSPQSSPHSGESDHRARRAAMLWLAVRSGLQALVMRSLDALVLFFEEGAGVASLASSSSSSSTTTATTSSSSPVLMVSIGSSPSAGPALADMKRRIGEVFESVATSFNHGGSGHLDQPLPSATDVLQRHRHASEKNDPVDSEGEEVEARRTALFRVLDSNDDALETMAIRYSPAVLTLTEGPVEMVESMVDVREQCAGLQAALRLSMGPAQVPLTFMLVSFEIMHSWIGREGRSAMQKAIATVEGDTKGDLVMIKKDSKGITKRLDKAFEHDRGKKDADTIDRIRSDMVPEIEGRCRRVQLKMDFLCEQGALSSALLESYREARRFLLVVSEQLSALR
jgi:hypothetical protein